MRSFTMAAATLWAMAVLLNANAEEQTIIETDTTAAETADSTDTATKAAPTATAAHEIMLQDHSRQLSIAVKKNARAYCKYKNGTSQYAKISNTAELSDPNDLSIHLVPEGSLPLVVTKDRISFLVINGDTLNCKENAFLAIGDSGSYQHKAPVVSKEHSQNRIANLSKEKQAFLLDQVKAAKNLTRTGVALYCTGMGIEVLGAIVLINGVVGGGEDAIITGLSITLAGGATNLSGQIVSNVGGSKAQTALEYANMNSQGFYGWGLWGASMGLNLVGTLISSSSPDAAPITLILSIASLGFSIATQVNASLYVNQAQFRMTTLRDIHIAPYASGRSTGLVLSATY